MWLFDSTRSNVEALLTLVGYPRLPSGMILDIFPEDSLKNLFWCRSRCSSIGNHLEGPDEILPEIPSANPQGNPRISPRVPFLVSIKKTAGTPKIPSANTP